MNRTTQIPFWERYTMSVEEVEMLADVKNFGALMANCLAATGDANQSALAMAQRFGKESTFSVNAVIPFSRNPQICGAAYYLRRAA